MKVVIDVAYTRVVSYSLSTTAPDILHADSLAVKKEPQMPHCSPIASQGRRLACPNSVGRTQPLQHRRRHISCPTTYFAYLGPGESDGMPSVMTVSGSEGFRLTHDLAWLYAWTNDWGLFSS